jgi:thiamine pyrophosphate-dependent acetolactate synthase large subunit-like protein
MKADRVVTEASPMMGWGSDMVAELLRRLGIKYVCINPGSSFRGLHDSLVNYLGNDGPVLLLSLHEQSAVAIAHGYYKASGQPMAVVLHSNVGLMAGMMSIFNAWCDRVPIIVFGATGAVDSAVRRNWIDWNHTLRDQGALVRHFVKWDEQPATPRAAIDAILRAYQSACSAPCGPVYVILDRRLQEDALKEPIGLPGIDHYKPIGSAAPSNAMLDGAVALLSSARCPVILLGRMSQSRTDWDNRIRLAERLHARVVTDLRMGASFPTEHPLHSGPADLFLSPQNKELLAGADVVLSLDWYDLADTLTQAGCEAKIIHVSIDRQVHNSFSGDHQRLAAIDLEIPVRPDELLAPLLMKLGASPAAMPAAGPAAVMPCSAANADAIPTLADIGRAVSRLREGRKITLARLPLNWPAQSYAFREPLDYLGYDGGRRGLGTRHDGRRRTSSQRQWPTGRRHYR